MQNGVALKEDAHSLQPSMTQNKMGSSSTESSEKVAPSCAHYMNDFFLIIMTTLFIVGSKYLYCCNQDDYKSISYMI